MTVTSILTLTFIVELLFYSKDLFCSSPLLNLHSPSTFPPPCLSASLHSSLSFSAYLTTMATGDVLACTEMRHAEKTGLVCRRARRRQSPHVCFVAERHDPMSKHGRERKGTGENVWKWGRKAWITVVARNDGDVDWKCDNGTELEGANASSKPPVHGHLLGFHHCV